MDKTQTLTRSQLAKRWGVTPQTIFRKDKNGEFPFLPIPVPGPTRYRIKDIEEYEMTLMPLDL